MSEEQEQSQEQQSGSNEQGGEENYEELAKAEGWSPKENWRGPEDQWIDAKTFVERGREILPIVRGKLAKSEERIRRMEEAFSKMNRANEAALEHQRQEHLKELKEARKKAIATNDGDAFDEAEESIRKLESETKRGGDEHDPVIKGWHDENEWYTKDADLTDYADTIAPGLRAKFPNLGPREFLDRLGKEVKKHFPDKFENPRRKTAAVENGGSRQSEKKGKTFEDLPPEAKDAYAKINRKLPSYTREQYAKSYFEGE